MTNKEVINFLNQVRKILLDDKSWLESTIQPINEAFDMAINALTAQPKQAVKGCRNCKYGKYNDHWKTRFCYNPNECTEWNLWEPDAQHDKHTETHACDLIDRQKAIDAYGDWYVEEGTEEGFIGTVKQLLEGLPPAQPASYQQVTGKLDCISRQAAIEAIADCTNCGDEKTLRAYVAKHNLDNGWTGGVLDAIDAVIEVPSAQPEIIHCRECKYHIDGFFCQKANHHTSGNDYCASVLGAERTEK